MKFVVNDTVKFGELTVGHVRKMQGERFVSVKELSQSLDLDYDDIEWKTLREKLFAFSYLDCDGELLIPVDEYPAWIVSVLSVNDLRPELQRRGYKAVMHACGRLFSRVSGDQKLYLVRKSLQAEAILKPSRAA